jgi:hypothetical protein
MDIKQNEAIDLSTLSEPTPPPVKRGSVSLLIALIVSTLFLVAAVGVGVWMVWQKNNSSANVQPTDNTATKDVKKVTWVVPTTLPAVYVQRNENTHTAVTSYFYDDATICGLTTTVSNVSSTKGSTAKEAVTNMAKDGALQGVTLISSFDGADFTIKDATTEEEYPFKSLDITQNVNVEGIAFKKQNTTAVFKQFGDHLASIAMTCQESTWDTKKAELEKVLKTFTLKVER